MTQDEITLSKLSNNQIYEIEKLRKFDKDLILKYAYKVHWYHISQTDLTEEEIDYFKNYLKWDVLFSKRKLSIELLRKYNKKIDWKYASNNSTLTKDIIDEFHESIDWSVFSFSPCLTEPILEKYGDKIDWAGAPISKKVSEKFLLKHKDEIFNKDPKNKGKYHVSLRERKFSEGFLEQIKDLILDFESITIIKHLSEKFIANNITMFTTTQLETREFSEDFIRKNKFHLSWNRISFYKNLSDDFILEHKDFVNWETISLFRKFSKEFFVQALPYLNIDKVFKNKKLDFLDVDVKFENKDLELLLKLNGYVIIPTIKKER
jgi:hypothetical protein